MLSGFVNSWDMAAWLAEQAAAGIIDFESDETGKDEAVVMVRRQAGDGFAGGAGPRVRGSGADAAGHVRLEVRHSVEESRGPAQELARHERILGPERPAPRDVGEAPGLVAGLGGLTLVIIGGTMATSAGTTALVLVALGAALTSAGFCAALSIWGLRGAHAGGDGGLAPGGIAAAVPHAVPRRRRRRRRPDRPARGVHRVGGRPRRHRALVAHRLPGRGQHPAAGRDAGDRQELRDSYYWLRHATLADTLATSCHASSYMPRTTTASSAAGSSGGSSYRSSSSSSVGGGSGGGGGGSW